MKRILLLLCIIASIVPISCNSVSCPLDDELWYMTADGARWDVSTYELLGKQLFSESNRIVANERVKDVYVIKFSHPITSINLLSLNNTNVSTLYFPSTIKSINVPKGATRFKYLDKIVVDDACKLPDWETVRIASKIKNKYNGDTLSSPEKEIYWLDGTWYTNYIDSGQLSNDIITGKEGVMEEVRFSNSHMQYLRKYYSILTELVEQREHRKLINDFALKESKPYYVEGLRIHSGGDRDSVFYIIDEKQKRIINRDLEPLHRHDDETWLSQMLRIRKGTAVFFDKNNTGHYMIVQPESLSELGIVCRVAYVYPYTKIGGTRKKEVRKCSITLTPKADAKIVCNNRSSSITHERVPYDYGIKGRDIPPIIYPIEICFNTNIMFDYLDMPKLDNFVRTFISYWSSDSFTQKYADEITYYYSKEYDDIIEKEHEEEMKRWRLENSSRSSAFEIASSFNNASYTLSRQIQNTVDPIERSRLIRQRDSYSQAATTYQVLYLMGY